jgi:hypothetical protein
MKPRVLSHNGLYTYFKYTVKGPLTGDYPETHDGSHHAHVPLSTRTIAKRLRESWSRHTISNVEIVRVVPSGRVVYCGEND